MAVELVLYVSAAAEMDPECELLGQMLAALPRSARWTIKRTPGSGEPANPDLTALRSATAYVMLLGADLVAPMGVEWTAAENAGVTASLSTSRPGGVAGCCVFCANRGPLESYGTAGEFAAHFERR